MIIVGILDLLVAIFYFLIAWLIYIERLELDKVLQIYFAILIGFLSLCRILDRKAGK